LTLGAALVHHVGVNDPQLPYRILDADNHFNEPADCYERYIDPSKSALAIRSVVDPSGRRVQLFAGRPSAFHSAQVTYSKEELEKMLGQVPGEKERFSKDRTSSVRGIPGMLLNRLNPLRGLDEEQRAELITRFRELEESYGNRDLRLALMDDQGIEAAIMYPQTAHDIEFELADDIEALYANVRAFNRWIHEEVGFAYQNRMFLPPYIPLADVDLAVAELETVLSQGSPLIQLKAGHAHGGAGNPFGGKSVADPVLDPLWARVNEAGVGVAVHLGGTDYQKYGADWSEDPRAVFGDFDAFQWVMYWGDRPAMELVGGTILHGLFSRYPNLRFCLSEQGTVWLPYILRKMDHAFLMGRKGKWATLDRRPSEVFREHFVVAPFPEENVRRVADDVGTTPLVFGSDFPHGEGLAWPRQYVSAQLGGFSAEEVHAIMRGNLARFLKLAA
jgi:predicted TIM-barrel fold metal-dependent hydrolase